MTKFTREEALRYHSCGRPGKIEVIPTKPYNTQYDLSMAYTPGVAEPCLEIQKNNDDAYIYTAKCNLVAVISNGTAVLGLGDIGALAGKPVMEGKGLLFKVFADVDVFDIEVNEKSVDKLIATIEAISPTFGGINLEDIKAPECFEVEERLKQKLDIPVFHDDQHGTAIISGAGLLNALEIIEKKINEIKVVINGAGAAAISCAKLYKNLGVKADNIYMLDSKGLITAKRTDLNKHKQEFARDVSINTLAEVLKGADVFLGLSVGNILTPDMLKTMAPNPIVFAMANPVPEIAYDEAIKVRPDIIMATGRSDYPNQINNVLGFPFIFRGALDVRAKTINEEMKLAAVHALAKLAKEDVPEAVNVAYKVHNLSFGKEYIIPKPLDPRLITNVAPAVAKAAMETGVARIPITDWKGYSIELMKRMGLYNKLVDDIRIKAGQQPKRIIMADASNFKVIKAAHLVHMEGIAKPVLMGNEDEIHKMAKQYNLDLAGISIIDNYSPKEDKRRKRYAQLLFEKRQRKGMTYDEAHERIKDPNYFGVMMVETGDADGFLAGFSTRYANTIRPALQIIGSNNTQNHIAGMYIIITKQGPFFFADTTVNINPSSRALADTALLTANEVRRFNMVPKIAMLSFSNFGSNRTDSPNKVREAVEILHRDYPDLIVDGEIQATFAFNRQLRMEKFPFSKLADMEVNTVIFPDLNAGNIAYKMMQELAGAEVIGPVLMGIRKPINVLQMSSSVREIVNMTAITGIDAKTVSDEIISL
ncbi:MAG: NADP-dependent malic enzyme [Bacteroidales bacterium]|nr:NADP-dependent malic enzyme [Bacteroidales bacterium]MBN2764534.1 NADP-dependent malic enzyme [Bacteroidales bacterium]